MNSLGNDAAILAAVNKITLRYESSGTSKTFGQWVLDTVFPQAGKEALVNGEHFVQEVRLPSAKTYLTGALVRKELDLATLEAYLQTTPAPVA